LTPKIYSITKETLTFSLSILRITTNTQCCETDVIVTCHWPYADRTGVQSVESHVFNGICA